MHLNITKFQQQLFNLSRSTDDIWIIIHYHRCHFPHGNRDSMSHITSFSWKIPQRWTKKNYTGIIWISYFIIISTSILNRTTTVIEMYFIYFNRYSTMHVDSIVLSRIEHQIYLKFSSFFHNLVSRLPHIKLIT